MIAGLLSAPWCYGLVEIVKDKLVIDDALDVFAVHGMGGFLGTLCIGIFADENVNEVGLRRALRQAIRRRRAGTAVYAYAVGFALVKVIEKFMKIIPPQHALELGLDASIRRARVQGHLPERRQDCRLMRRLPTRSGVLERPERAGVPPRSSRRRKPASR